VADQAPGDSVWSASRSPTWSESGGAWAATVVAPSGLDLREGAVYDVTVVVTDPRTGLSSDEASATVRVAWARRALEPGGATVTPYDTTDSHGRRSIGAIVALPTLAAPQAGDLMDVWRVTPDGAERVATGVPGGTTVNDPYAPYGGTPSYRVALRTPDGDVAWSEVGYELASENLRVDFGGDYVELPYNLKLASGWGKDFEVRQHLDGSADGYWNRAVSRTSSVGTAIVRASGGETEALRRLARHAGPCFVRTPDGEAFEANVDVSGLDRAFDDGSVAVSLSVTGVSLTDDYRATTS
jgi:hypothetical protein